MSDANLTKLLYVKEAAFATVPAGPPKLKEIRFLSSGLSHEKLTVMSEEIRSDRSRSKLIEVGKNAGGPLETEFIVGAYNDFILAALMQQSWTEANEVVTGTISAAGNTFTRGAGNFSATLQGAKYVHIAGATNPTNNGIKRVSSWTNTVLTVDDFTNDEVGVALEITVKYARNGVHRDSFVIEQQYLGLSPDYFIALVGMGVNQWTLNMEAQARVMQTFEFMGAKALLSDPSATVGDGAPTAASTRSICNTTGNIGGLIWNGAAFMANVMGFDMTLNNNLRNRPAISREITLEHGKGLCEPDGTLNAYFESPDQFEDFINHVAASLLLPIRDPDGNLMSIFLPHLEFPSGFPTIEGINTDVMLPLEFNATHDAAIGYTIQVDQLDAEFGS